jgi:opacity protein-like surface antigen
MKTRLVFFVATLLILCATVAWAADVSGKWTAQIPGRNGEMRETTFNFKVEGEKLTGTMSGFQGAEVPISDGKVSGDDISFVVTMSFGGNDVKLNYKGKVSGEEIKFTRTREGSDRPPQEFTAKKAK